MKKCSFVVAFLATLLTTSLFAGEVLISRSTACNGNTQFTITHTDCPGFSIELYSAKFSNEIYYYEKKPRLYLDRNDKLQGTLSGIEGVSDNDGEGNVTTEGYVCRARAGDGDLWPQIETYSGKVEFDYGVKDIKLTFFYGEEKFSVNIKLDYEKVDIASVSVN